MRWGTRERPDGKPPKEEFRAFATAVKAALAAYENKLLNLIEAQGQDASNRRLPA